MSRTEELHASAKDFGVIKLAKYLNEEGHSHGITEFEFSKMIAEEAAARKISFTDYYSAPETLEIRKAIQLTKFPDMAAAIAEPGSERSPKRSLQAIRNPAPLRENIWQGHFCIREPHSNSRKPALNRIVIQRGGIADSGPRAYWTHD